jgi:hypothetical protein
MLSPKRPMWVLMKVEKCASIHVGMAVMSPAPPVAVTGSSTVADGDTINAAKR